MWLIAGEPAHAAELARAARTLVAVLLPEANDADAYWLLATDAEAALILGDLDAAADALSAAALRVDGDLARAATTRRQLTTICEHVGIDLSVLAPLAPPRIVHYCGHMIAAPGATGRFPSTAEDSIAKAIAAQVAEVAMGFGSLACGADILYAEALLARGVELHVHLPCVVDDFIAASVDRGGPGWRERFHRCLERATTVSIATSGRYLDDPELFAYCSRVAMGHALIRADFLAASAEQLAVWDGCEPEGAAGTAVDVAAWARTGRPTHVVPVSGDGAPAPSPDGKGAGRVVRAMLFADLAGFGRLDDSHIPSFLDAVMQPLASVIERFDPSIRFRNTWGDGIYLVFDDVVSAAACALEMQAVLEAIDLDAASLPRHLAMRVAAHAGPVLERRDPVRDTTGFYGVEVTRAARMEPRTPEGAVYVTDQFAALLALEPDASAACQYVGRLPSAKDFGTFPMYVLTTRR
jgi:class 3 adenylate cyclase